MSDVAKRISVVSAEFSEKIQIAEFDKHIEYLKELIDDLSKDLETKASVEDVCAAPIVQAFTPAQHISVSLYQGYALNLQTIDGAFTIQNSTAMGMPETLLTLVLSPKDAAADTYFADFPSEHINLDDLYL